MREDLNRALETLSPREQFIIRGRFGFDNQNPKTLEEIGGYLNLTRERVRQIESRALRRLKNNPLINEYNKNR